MQAAMPMAAGAAPVQTAMREVLEDMPAMVGGGRGSVFWPRAKAAPWRAARSGLLADLLTVQPIHHPQPDLFLIARIDTQEGAGWHVDLVRPDADL